jgi:hypothetical protein
VPASTGCDTVRHLQLTVNPLEQKEIFETTCDTFTYNGVDYTVAGDYVIDTLDAIVGCDSILTLHLSFLRFNEDTIHQPLCQGQVYVYNGMTFNATGFYTLDTLNGVAGECDTILTLDLVINPLPTANAGADKILDCANQTVTLDGIANGGTPLWSGPDINAGNENQPTPTVSLPGTYVLVVTSAANCVSSDTVIVNSDPQNIIADAGDSAAFNCIIDTIFLQGNPSGPKYYYQWSGPGINAAMNMIRIP